MFGGAKVYLGRCSVLVVFSDGLWIRGVQEFKKKPRQVPYTLGDRECGGGGGGGEVRVSLHVDTYVRRNHLRVIPWGHY